MRRMAWLDGLRAVAVLLVLYAHLSRYVFRGAREVTAEWLHAGTAGVMLFFLVSGYIIPASLERHGDLRKFWVSRLRRLLPLYLVVAIAALALLPYATDHPLTAVTAHLTMLPFLLGVPLVTPVFWTLTFEMVFYLLVTALFAVRLHRADAVVAVLLAGLAVLTVPLAPMRLPVGPAVAVTAVVLSAGLAAVVSGRRWAVIPGALLLGGLAGALLLGNMDPAHAWDGLLILAVMFTGTVIYRADSGQTGWWPVLVVAPVVAAALLANWFAELRSLDALTPQYQARSVITLLVFAGAFAAGRWSRRWRTPRWLAWLGVISYSLYLLHYVVLQLLGPTLAGLGRRWGDAPVAAVFLALLIGLGALTHRYVELPGQGRMPGRQAQSRPAAISAIARREDVPLR